MRQQLIDAAGQVVGQPCEHVLQVRPRVMTMHLGGLRQAHDDSGALAGQRAACEQPGLAAHGPGPHEIFNMVVIDRHVAIEQVDGQSRPAVQAVVDGIGDGAAIGARAGAPGAARHGVPRKAAWP